MTVALVGYGALGKQVKFLLEAVGKRDFVFFDDPAFSRKEPGARPFQSCIDAEFSGAEFYVCLGYKMLKARREWLGKLSALGRKLPPFVHPSSFVSPSASVGPGVIVYPGCNIDQSVVIRSGALLNNSVTLSHETEIGEAAFLSPGVIVCGAVSIGAETFIGAGSVISNGVRIGSRCRIGAASLVSAAVPDGASAIGNPLRLLKAELELS